MKNCTMFERYILTQEKKANAVKQKANAAQKAVQLRDRYQRLQEMKYKNKILRIRIADMLRIKLESVHSKKKLGVDAVKHHPCLMPVLLYIDTHVLVRKNMFFILCLCCSFFSKMLVVIEPL